MRLAGVGGYFGADATAKPLLHLWSLSIEEQFYLVWSVLLLALFKLERRLVLFVILGVFVASFAFCVVLTPIDPIAAFYLPWTRGWELALGALIAYREVFWLDGLPYPSRRIANIGAGARHRADARRLPVPERDAALSRLAARRSRPLAARWSSPIRGSLPGEVALGNRVAGFFGVISYPLYLWHWPLFAFAHIWPGVIPTTPVLFALAGVAVVLAALTYRLIEQPIAAPFRRRPFATALVLVGLLALTGIVGRLTYDAKGFPSRFPAARRPHLRLRRQRRRGRAAHALLLSARRGALFARRGARAGGALLRGPSLRGDRATRAKPTILIVGDSHAAHLFAGLAGGLRRQSQSPDALLGLLRAPGRERRHGRRAWRARRAAARSTTTCSTRSGRSSRTSLIVGGYFAQYDHEANWRYPGYLDALVAGARRLHARRRALDHRRRRGSDLGARSADPRRPRRPRARRGGGILTGRRQARLARRPTGRSRPRTGARAFAMSRRRRSSAAPEGCRRLIGANLPEDLLAVDYGHYSLEGSVFAVRTILAPVIDAELARFGKN